LTTIVNEKGDTDLLVGGDGIWHFKATDFLQESADGVQICSGPNFQGISDMHVARNSHKVNVWVTTGDKGVSYLEVKATDIRETSTNAADRGTPLIAPGKGGDIAGFVDHSGRNALFVCDTNNNMTYMEQAPDTLLWKQTPFWIPSALETLKLHSYMTRVVIHDEKEAVVPGAWVALSSTGWVDVVINGAPVQLGQNPTSIQADAEGAVSIINPATDLSSYRFSVSEILDSDKKAIHSGPPIPIDPMAKVNVALSGMTTEKLSSAKGSDGQAVFGDCTAEQLEQAAGALKDIESVRLSKESVKDGATSTLSAVSSPLAVRASATDNLWAKAKKVAWSFWNFVTSSWEKVKKWAIQTWGKLGG
jgi:hypothetical protein